MFSRRRYRTLIKAVDQAVTANEKGSRFEDLCEYLFGLLEGVEVAARDTQLAAEEIDLVLWNAQLEEVLRPWENVILLECKNWTAPVGAPLLDNFISKMRRRALKTGIFVAANGVTGQFLDGDRGAVEIVKQALQEGIRVIVIRMEDIREIGSLDDLRGLIKKRYLGLYLHRVL